MPEMDGLEVLRRLNDLGYLERLPVFLITAEAVESTMREAYRLGVMDVISKPIIPYVVLRRVNSVVELFRARKRLGAVVQQQHSQLLDQAQKIIELNHGMLEALSRRDRIPQRRIRANMSAESTTSQSSFDPHPARRGAE